MKITLRIAVPSVGDAFITEQILEKGTKRFSSKYTLLSNASCIDDKTQIERTSLILDYLTIIP